MELVLGLLAAATALAAVARHLNIPYPVVLVVGGAVLAAIPAVPEVTVKPAIVFLVFLPPLLYSAALSTSTAEMRHSVGPILILAVALVLATVLAIAAVAHLLIGLPWAASFVLGAILGATDPVSATAIIRRLGAPQRIATLLEGEALINDGTALIAFKVALAAAGASSFSPGHGVLAFLAVSAGGMAIGLELADRGIEVLAPVRETPARDGRLGKRDFDIDLDSGTVICPAGHRAPIRTQPSGQRRALFSRAACGSCPLRSRCIGPRMVQKKLWLAPDEELLAAARHALEDPVSAEHVRRTRPRIERLLGLLAHRYGARKSRYIGSAKARLQALWAAALVNLNPIGQRLASQNA